MVLLLTGVHQVLHRHAGVEEVLAAATRCLSSMVTNPEYAAALLRSGAMSGMVESVIQNPAAEKVQWRYTVPGLLARARQ